jgi:hypothetical protein
MERGAMSHPLPISFSSLLLPPDAPHGPFRVAAGNDWIRIGGHLSAGGRGWVLDARASLHRRQITLWVSATQESPGAIRSVEDHGYRALLEGVRPGRYEIRVVHRFVSPLLDSGVHSWPLHGETIQVGESLHPLATAGPLLALLASISFAL